MRSARCAENRARWDSLCDIKSAQVTYLNEALAAALGNKFEGLPAVSNSADSVDIPSNRSDIFLISLQNLVNLKIQFMVQTSPDTGDGVAASHRGRPGAGEARRVPDVGGG